MTSTLPIVLLCLVPFLPSSLLRSQVFPCAVCPSLDTTFSPILIHCLIVCPAHTHVLVQHTYTTHHTYIHTCICKHIYVHTCIHQTHIHMPAHTYTHMHTYTQETVNTTSHTTHKTYTTHITHTPHIPYTHTNMQVYAHTPDTYCWDHLVQLLFLVSNLYFPSDLSY